MTRTLLWMAIGLLLAGVVHIVSILAIPKLAPNDAFLRLQRFGEANQMHVIPPMTPRSQPLIDMDPTMRYAVCSFDLSQAPLRLFAKIPPTYWVATFYDRHGVSFYTINDRSIAADQIELWLATKQQLLDYDLSPDDEEQQRLIIGAPEELGFVLIRLIVPETSMNTTVRDALAASECASLEATGSLQR